MKKPFLHILCTITFGTGQIFCLHEAKQAASEYITGSQRPETIIHQLQPIIITNPLASANPATHTQKIKTKEELQAEKDDALGIKILEIFATRLVPSFVQMVAGVELGNPEQEIEGIKNFASGVFDFLVHATRHPEQLENIIETFEKENITQDDIFETTALLMRSLKEKIEDQKQIPNSNITQ